MFTCRPFDVSMVWLNVVNQMQLYEQGTCFDESVDEGS